MRGLKLFLFEVHSSALCESEAITLAAISEHFSISLTAFEIQIRKKDCYANRLCQQRRI